MARRSHLETCVRDNSFGLKHTIFAFTSAASYTEQSV